MSKIPDGFEACAWAEAMRGAVDFMADIWPARLGIYDEEELPRMISSGPVEREPDRNVMTWLRVRPARFVLDEGGTLQLDRKPTIKDLVDKVAAEVGEPVECPHHIWAERDGVDSCLGCGMQRNPIHA